MAGNLGGTSSNRNEFIGGQKTEVSRANSRFRNVNDSNQELSDAIQTMVTNTLDSYERMYGKNNREGLRGLQRDYLEDIKTAESDHYKALTSKNGNDPDNIIKQYKNMYKELEEMHKNYLKNTKIGNVVSASNPNQTASNIVDTTILNNIYKEIKKIAKNGGSGENNTPNRRDNFIDDNNRRNNFSEDEKQMLKSAARLGDVTNDLLSRMNQSLVRDQQVNKMIDTGVSTLGKIFDIVSAIAEGGSIAESIAGGVAGIAVMLFTKFIEYLAEASADYSQTKEEIYQDHQIFMRNLNGTMGFAQENLNIQERLYAENLENNIKATDIQKQQLELAKKGLSVQQAQEAGFNTAIYNVIAPALNTNSDIFLDLQAFGMKKVTDSLAGVVEAVRDNAGSSRIAVGALDTVITKLGPMELYAKKGLLGEEATRLFEYLQGTGLSTEEAVSLASSISGVESNLYGSLTSGSTMEKLVAQQIMSGGIEFANLADAAKYYLTTAGQFQMSGQNPLAYLLRGATNTAIGAGLSQFTDIRDLNLEGTNVPDREESQAEKSFNDLYQLLADDQLQTPSAMRAIYVTNQSIGTGVSELMEILQNTLYPIKEALMALAEKLVGTDWKLQRDINSAYTAAATAESRADKARLLSEAMKLEYDNTTSSARKKELESQYAQLKSSISNLSSEETRELVKLGGIVGLSQYGYNPNTGELNKNVANLDPMLQYESGLTYEFGETPGAAKGAYLTEATPLIAGEAGPEFVIPENKLIDTLEVGMERYMTNHTIQSDYTPVITAIYTSVAEVVKAINNSNGNVQITVDSSTGLMTSKSSKPTNLSPLMGNR